MKIEKTVLVYGKKMTLKQLYQKYLDASSDDPRDWLDAIKNFHRMHKGG